MPSSNYTALPLQEPVSEGDSNNIQSIQDTEPGDSSVYPSELPPEYEPSPDFQEMEIEDASDILEQGSSRESIRSKANRFASDFNRRVVQPINQALDPVYQLYCYANAQFELHVAKLGNPLIVKRILFISFITIILYGVSLTGIATTDSLMRTQSDFTDIKILEDFIESSIDVGRIEETIQYLSSMPRLSGTAADFTIAQYFANTIRSGTLQRNPDITFNSYHNYPLNPHVKLYKGDQIIHECTLKENYDGELENDYFSLAFNPGSKSGSARGNLLYVNNGEYKDYKYLVDQHIEIKDKIVIIKYGGKLPAYTKLRYAQERGAKGVLFISDPSQEGIYTMNSLQREPVAYADILPGNIIAPGLDSSYVLPDDAPFSKYFDDSPVAPKIPSLPISWHDFIDLMSQTKGHGLHFQEWDFNLNNNMIEIWIGDDDLEIDLNNELTIRPNKVSWNILAKLTGKEQDTFGIIIGASRDSVCYGAMESSGSAILLELINIFSEMSHSLHWKPLRSIFFASYSGSKFNMAGSSNFATKQSDFFRRDVYAYIDLDDIIQGDEIRIDGDPIFSSMLINSVKHVMERSGNDTHVSFDETSIGAQINPYGTALTATKHHGVGGISLKLVKSAKDETTVPQYAKNSCIDDFENFKNSHVDPDLSKHLFMAKLVASVILRLVEAPILPYDIRSALDSWENNFKSAMSFVDHQKGQPNADNSLKNIHYGDVNRLLNQMRIIAEEYDSFVATWNDICENGKGPEPNLLAVHRWDWNGKLLLYLKVMLSIEGVFDNPWEYNVLYGTELNPGSSTSDEIHHALPGIWNAINRSNWDALQYQIDLLARMLKQGFDLFQH